MPEIAGYISMYFESMKNSVATINNVETIELEEVVEEEIVVEEIVVAKEGWWRRLWRR